jgi:hypothetical protein
MAPKKKKVATVHYYEDGAYQHDKPSPVTVTILKAPDIDDLVEKVGKRTVRVDESRRTWLSEGSGAYKKINIRKGNLKEKAIYKTLMKPEDDWCTWCQDRLLLWFNTPVSAHATPKLALKDAPESAHATPKLALKDATARETRDEEKDEENKDEKQKEKKFENENGDKMKDKKSNGLAKNRARSTSSSSSSSSTSSSECAPPQDLWRGSNWEDVANSLAWIAPDASNERDCVIFGKVIKALDILYKRPRAP